MSGKKYQSCLIPFVNEIISLRRQKPPMPFPAIAELLKEKYQVSVTRQAIQKFLKVRVKGFPVCKYAWNIEMVNDSANQPSTETPPVSVKSETKVSPVRETPKPATDKSVKSEKQEWESQPFEMAFSETYNLTRLSPEEAEARNKIIEEKIRAKYHKK